MRASIRKIGLRAGLALAAALVLAFAAAPIAAAGGTGGGPGAVSGAVYTSTDPAFDGPDRCKNGPSGLMTPTIDCNIYLGKQYVWLNGGPNKNSLSPAGTYFFSILVPGGEPNPNDPTLSTPNPKNLSCPTVGCVDPVSNRTFTIDASGEISAYGGTHTKDATSYPANGMLIRACLGTGPFCPPYMDTTNPGGEYVMAVCLISADKTTLDLKKKKTLRSLATATPSNCKYDNFKVRTSDTTPPMCKLTATGIDGTGHRFIQVTVSDDTGLLSITPTTVVNASVVISPTFVPNDPGPYVITATRIDKTKGAQLALTITDSFGNVTKCDPVMATLRAHRAGGTQPIIGRFTALPKAEGLLRIENGTVGFKQIVVTVNGRVFHLTALKQHQKRLVDVRSAMRPGSHNTVVIRGIGAAGARAEILISD